mgnify:CR=1 FL=1
MSGADVGQHEEAERAANPLYVCEYGKPARLATEQEESAYYGKPVMADAMVQKLAMRCTSLVAAMRRIQSACGHPDAAEACRTVLAIAKEALEAESTVRGATPSPGVSIQLFAAVEAHLRKRHNGRNVCLSAEAFNRWIAALGDIEREYVALAEEEHRKTEAQKEKARGEKASDKNRHP